MLLHCVSNLFQVHSRSCEITRRCEVD